MGATTKICSLILFAVMSLCYSASGQRKDKTLEKAYRYGDYQSVMKLSEEMNLDDMASQFKMVARSAFEFGFFEKAANFFEKSALLDQEKFQEKDVVSYCYTLLKCGKENKILTDSLFLSYALKSKDIKQLVDAAASRSYFRQLDLPGIKTKELELDGILSRYGMSFNDYFLYFSYLKDDGRGKDEELLENQIFVSRVSDLSRIGQVRLSSSGSVGAEGTILCDLPKNRRIVTICKELESKTEFYTVVPGTGKPERIEITGNKFPPFPYNSDQYACAMPYFEESENRLYFSSTMMGGSGGWDIYFVDFDGVGWSNPISAGEQVNSPFDELFPVKYGNLLGYSSDGWEGCGGFDNYVIDTKENRRINLFPFNGEGDDYSFQLVEDFSFRGVGILDKKPAFFSSSKDFATLVDEIRQVIDGDQDQDFILPAVPLANVDDAAENKSVKMSAAPAVIKRDEVPAIEKGEVPFIQNQEESAVSILPSTVKTRKVGEVFFEINSPVIQSNYYSVIDDLVKQIIKDDSRFIIVWGHADRSGTGMHNDYLSFMRAHSVVEYMKNRLEVGNVKRFFTIVAGEGYATGVSDDNLEDRKVVVSMANKELQYDMVYAYKSQPTQSLSDIALLFNNDVELLKKLNDITEQNKNRLTLVGVQGIHLVKRGETLYQVSKYYRCTESSVQKANNKVDCNVFAGEKLIIPLASY